MTDQGAVISADVAIIGGGPAGLTAAASLRARGVESVLVLERESQAGGIPRHSDHPGYGVRDLRRSLSGPEYARRLVERARDAGATIRTEAMVTQWIDDRAVLVTSPAGRLRVDARAIVLATGARERGRAARMVPGDRPNGVLTTGQLQNLVHLKHERSGGIVGHRAVIVGAELVGWSAVLTLRQAGCGAVLMTSEYEHAESYGALSLAARSALRVPVTRRTRVTGVIGRERVEAVEIMRLDTGQRRMVECDTVVFTGDWIPDNELARMRGLVIDPGHLGPVVDAALRTSADGIFGAGNLLHPVDTADVAALDGRHVAEQVAGYLAGAPRPSTPVRVLAGEGLAWVTPGRYRPDDPAPPRDRILAWATSYRPLPRVEARQGDRLVAAARLPWPASPGRVFRVPSSLLSNVRVGAGDVVIALA
jgi:thioredoxin reductase